MQHAKHRISALLLAVVMTVTMMAFPATAADNAGTIYRVSTLSDITAQDFREPGMQYRPGVRWWLPGGAIEADEMKREVELLAENGFGTVEINPFGKTGSWASGYDDRAPYDLYQTDGYYDALEAAFAAARETGMTVTLNMGSGWNANDSSVQIQDSMGNMAIGRSSISVTSLGTSLSVEVPDALKSPNYDSGDMVWDDIGLVLQAVIIAPIVGENEGVIDNDKAGGFMGPAKIQLDDDTSQYILDMRSAELFDLSQQSGTAIVDWMPSSEGEYAVIAIYFIPAGTRPIDSVSVDNAYVVDHMDGEKVESYMDNWIGATRLRSIVEEYEDVLDTYFNDSYEFYGDNFYNEKLYELAQDDDPDTSILGYDFTKYLSVIYQVGAAYPFYQGKGSSVYYTIGTSGSGEANADEQARIRYDYNLLANELFMDGLKAFQEKCREYNGLYKQEAYNPPIDTLGAAKYVDVPEAEQENENNLRRAGSGAHLYGRPIATAEQYTLGNTPFKVQFEKVKNGIDLMATSGINNFYYHGFSYAYYGDEQMQAEHAYGETGYQGFFGTGIGVGEKDSIWPYYKNMNAYAARTNYLMQQGSPSVDVALYMPTFGALNSTGGAAQQLNSYGFAWDGVNDESILNAQVEGGKIVVQNNAPYTDSNYTMTYSALVLESDTVPLTVMEKLEQLDNDGATIVFYQTAPSKQPSYLDGAYAAADAQVANIASSMEAVIDDGAELNDALENVRGPVSYAYNDSVRFIRRSLDDGGEIAYIRNAGTGNTTLNIQVDTDAFGNFYWLDQESGRIYEAQADNGTITLPLYGGQTPGTTNQSGQAIALLSLPEGTGFAAEDIESGNPPQFDWLRAAQDQHVYEIETFDLSITADNFGTSGEIHAPELRVYENIQPGDWGNAGYLNGDLRHVNAAGTYTAYLAVDRQPESLLLDLGDVYSIAEVEVNGELAGVLFHQPYHIDIADYITPDSANTISIKVTPRTYNRYIGFAKAHAATGENYYQYYASNISKPDEGKEYDYIETGLLSTVMVFSDANVSKPEESTASDKSTLNALLTAAKAIDASGYTAESYQALLTAIDIAQAVYDNPDATQAQIDAAVRQLQAAIDALVEVSTSSGGGSSRGSSNSSGGSSTRDTYGQTGVLSGVTAIAEATAAVTKEAALSATKSAVEWARANGDATAVVRLKNAGVITLEIMQTMAQEAGMPLTIHADSMNADGNRVDVRLYVDPGMATQDINLSASISAQSAQRIRALFEKWFGNTLQAVVLEQTESFGQEVAMAVKLDAGLLETDLVLYRYDDQSNTYTLLQGEYSVDANGYIHFKTDAGGAFIVSGGALVQK